jgi:hypothetical protein
MHSIRFYLVLCCIFTGSVSAVEYDNEDSRLEKKIEYADPITSFRTTSLETNMAQFQDPAYNGFGVPFEEAKKFASEAYGICCFLGLIIRNTGDGKEVLLREEKKFGDLPGVIYKFIGGGLIAGTTLAGSFKFHLGKKAGITLELGNRINVIPDYLQTDARKNLNGGDQMLWDLGYIVVFDDVDPDIYDGKDENVKWYNVDALVAQGESDEFLNEWRMPLLVYLARGATTMETKDGGRTFGVCLP